MAKQINWKYCDVSTTKHPLSLKYFNCLEKISDIIIREGGKKHHFSNQVVINIDKIEINNATRESRNLNKTVDIAFCIKKANQLEIVLVEFRFNYININNLNKTELDKKILYSKQIITSIIQIHNIFYFIFKKEIKNQAYNRLRRLYNNKANYIAIDVYDLNELFFNN